MLKIQLWITYSNRNQYFKCEIFLQIFQILLSNKCSLGEHKRLQKNQIRTDPKRIFKVYNCEPFFLLLLCISFKVISTRTYKRTNFCQYVNRKEINTRIQTLFVKPFHPVLHPVLIYSFLSDDRWLTLRVVQHPRVDAIRHGCWLAEVHRLHLCFEVLLHELQEVLVEVNPRLQKQGVGQPYHVLLFICGQGLRQVAQQRELLVWSRSRQNNTSVGCAILQSWKK